MVTVTQYNPFPYSDTIWLFPRVSLELTSSVDRIDRQTADGRWAMSSDVVKVTSVGRDSGDMHQMVIGSFVAMAGTNPTIVSINRSLISVCCCHAISSGKFTLQVFGLLTGDINPRILLV